jgi:hypothetical protein
MRQVDAAASVTDGAPAATTIAPSMATAGGSTGAPSPVQSVTPAPTPVGQQKIIKNATLSLEVKKGSFREAFDAAASAAGRHNGFVTSSESSVQKGETSTGVITLRVPADAFDAVRSELVKLGSVKDERLTGNDVGGQLVDLDARIRSLQAQEDAIRILMAKARTIGETIEVQNQLTQVRQQIEQLGGEKARLADAAALATIRVELAEPGAAVKQDPRPKPAPSPLRHSLTVAAHGAETVAAGTVIVLGWTIPMALLGLIGWALWRMVRRRAVPTFSAD